MHALDLQGQPLDLDLTLSCGQAFRWRRTAGGIWRGVVRDKLVELAREDGSLLWRTFPEDDPDLVRDYLRLAEDVNAIHAALSESDSHVAGLIRRFHGLRLVRQDPAETLLSFVCSTANSIPRIMAAIEMLAANYGRLVCEREDSCYYAFPTLDRLAGADPAALMESESLGFRARNVTNAARQILDRGDGWLSSLRNVPYQQARGELMSIRGVGRKIADCVCLFALGEDEAVPVDTHIRQLAHRLWLPEMKAKTITDAVYQRIVEAFAQRYGALAGWAQQFLYYEDLLRTRRQPPVGAKHLR